MNNPSSYAFNVDALLPSETEKQAPTKVILPTDLSEDQVEVYNQILTWRHDVNARQYLKVGGYAGTGKTTLVAALARELETQGEAIAYCAFTGKAVNVMSRKLRAAGINGHCSTLHSLMYRPKVEANGSVSGWTKVESLPFTMIVVDEASMVGAELWTDLLSYELPILAVGDHGQLPPVGDSVVNLMANPDLRLERIHRQAEGNPILALAQWVRDGKSHLSYNPIDDRVSFVKSFSHIAERVAEDPRNAAAICYTNKTRVALNNFIRVGMGREARAPQEGDTVVCLRNKKPIFNGMRGVLAHVEDGTDKYLSSGAVVEFTDDNLKLTSKIFRPQFNAPKTFDKLESIPQELFKEPPNSWQSLGMLFDYGYALTCHKAQGSQFRDVVIIWENLFRDADTRNRWMYTASTRAAERLWIVRP